MSASEINARPLGKDILVDIYDDGEENIDVGGGKKLILLSDTSFGRSIDSVEGKHPGIRPRWARVLATTDYAEDAGLSIGMKVLCDTMKWSRGVAYEEDKKLWRIPVEDILGIDDDGFTESELKHIEGRHES